MNPLSILPPDVAKQVTSHYPTIAALLVLYVVAFLALSLAAHRRYTGEADDYVVGSRSLGVIVTTFTLYASIFSGVGIAGFPGTVYVTGMGFITTVIVGFSMSAVLQWYFGRRIWALGKIHDFQTPGDLLGGYYQSETVRLWSVIASVVFNITFIVAQLTAGGILINVLSGGAVSFDAGVVIVAGIVFLHIVFTGIRGIAWLDTFNGVLILIALTLFGAFIFHDAGGIGHMMSMLGDAAPARTTIPGPVGVWSSQNIYGTAFGLLIGIAVFSPNTFLRFYATDKKENLAKVGIGMLTLLAVSHLVGTVWIGLYGRAVLPNVSNPDWVSSLLAFKVLPIPVAAFFLISVLAAIVSTTDSYVHTMSATVTRDFIEALFWEDMTSKQEVRVNYAIVVLSAVVGVIITVFNSTVITALATFAGGITLQLLPATFGSVSWPRATTEAAIVSTIVGIALTFVWELAIVPNPLSPMGFRGLFVAFVVNVVLFVAISYVTEPQSDEHIAAFHGALEEEL
ncbi:MAG: sodium:solute symporter [Salinigranum sp.]